MGAACCDGGVRWGRPLLLRGAWLIDPAGGGDFVGDVLVVGGVIIAAQSVKETIATGDRAGARGGFAALCCRPNADPPIDSALAYGGRSVTEEQVTAGGGDFVVVGDVFVAGGEIVAVRPVVDGVSGGCMVVDAGGLVVRPGFEETIDTGARSGARGGFTTLGHGGRMTVLYQLNAGVGD